jgi:hypothetical protein
MTRSNRRPARPDQNRRRPGLEALERRELLSLGAEFSATVNTTTRNAQFDSATASSANGSSVTVWVDTFSATDHDIRAQRFDAAGNKTGPEVLVTGTTLDETQPAVAMDALGDFVVAWRQTLSGGDTNVVARRFNPIGQPVGAVVQVGVGTFKEHDPSVAMDNSGHFVVAYTRDTNNNDPDVFAKKYDANNQLQAVVNVAVTAGRNEINPSVAMAPDGRFDVAWEQAFSATDHDVFLERFSAPGALLAKHTIALSTAFESLPSVSMDNFGNAVVAWQRKLNGNNDVLARRVSSAGALGFPNLIAGTPLGERSPSVALKRGGGGYVVAYETDTPSGSHIRVVEVTASDVVLPPIDAGARFSPAVSINGVNKYLLTYTAVDAGDLNIRRRIGTLS